MHDRKRALSGSHSRLSEEEIELLCYEQVATGPSDPLRHVRAEAVWSQPELNFIVYEDCAPPSSGQCIRAQDVFADVAQRSSSDGVQGFPSHDIPRARARATTVSISEWFSEALEDIRLLCQCIIFRDII